MAEANAIRAGRAFVEVGVDDSKLLQALARISAKLRAFSAGFRVIGSYFSAAGRIVTDFGEKLVAMGRKATLAGAALVGAFAFAVKTFIGMGTELELAAERTGIAVESLSALGYVAKRSGVGLDSLETSLGKMLKTVGQAEQGSTEAAFALAELGINVKDLKGLRPDEMFVTVADALGRVGDEARQSVIGTAIFGKSWRSLKPILDQGADGINALIDRAHELGIVMTGDQARAAKELGDMFGDLWAVLKMGAFEIGEALLPTMREFAAWTIRISEHLRNWIKQHQQAIEITAKLSAGIFAAGAAFVVLGTGMKIVGGALGGIGSAFALVGTVASTAMRSVVPIIGLLMSPLGMLGLALAGVAGYFVYTAGAGGRAMKFLSESFSNLKDDANRAFKGIADALASGEIALAAKILWKLLEVEWTRGSASLQEIMATFKADTLKLMYGTFYGCQAAWEIFQNAIQVGWIRMTSFLSDAWVAFSSTVQKVWESTQNYLAKKWIDLMGMFDKTLNTDAAKSMLDSASAATTSQINTGANAQYAAIDKDRRDRLGSQDKQYQDNMARIGQGYNDESASIDAATRQKATELQKSIDALKNQLADLQRRAAEDRAGGNAYEFASNKAARAQQAFGDSMGSMSTGAFGLSSAGLYHEVFGSENSTAKSIEANTAKTAQGFADLMGYIRNPTKLGAVFGLKVI